MNREREQYGWLRLPDGTNPHVPLSDIEMTSWLEICRRYTDAEISLAPLQIPERADLATPSDFAAAVAAEEQAKVTVSQLEELRAHPAYGPIESLARDTRDALASDLCSLEEQRLTLARVTEAWKQAATEDLVSGRRARWDTLAELTRVRLAEIETLLGRIGARVVVVPQGRDLRRLRADAWMWSSAWRT